MHDGRNFNNVSFESIMVILYDKGMTIVIHPGTWSQHPFVSGFCFFWDALYSMNIIINLPMQNPILTPPPPFPI